MEVADELKKIDFNYSIHINFKNWKFLSKGKTMFQQALGTQHCLLRTLKLKEKDRTNLFDRVDLKILVNHLEHF